MATENGRVTSGAILQEVRARVMAMVKNPRTSLEGMQAWEIELRMLSQLEIVYSRPEIIPIGREQYQVRP